MARLLLDTNVIVRFLTGDHPAPGELLLKQCGERNVVHDDPPRRVERDRGTGYRSTSPAAVVAAAAGQL